KRNPLEAHRHPARDRQVIARLARIELAGEPLEARDIVSELDPPPETTHHELGAAGAVARNVVLRLRLAVIEVVCAAAKAEPEEGTNPERGGELLFGTGFRSDVVGEDVDVFVRRRSVFGGGIREPAYCREMAIERVRAEQAGAKAALQRVALRAGRDERGAERYELEAVRRLLCGSLLTRA